MTPQRQHLFDIGWTVRDLAEATDHDDRTIRRFLAGKRGIPRLADWLERAAEWRAENPIPGKE